MVMITSAPFTAEAADCAAVPPPASNLSSDAATKSKPVTACCALARFVGMGRPMLPSPMKPMRAIFSSLEFRRMFSLRPFACGHQRQSDVGDHEQQLDRHD